MNLHLRTAMKKGIGAAYLRAEIYEVIEKEPNLSDEWEQVVLLAVTRFLEQDVEALINEYRAEIYPPTPDEIRDEKAIRRWEQEREEPR